MPLRHYLRRRIAVPSEHGAWVLFIGPLAIGIAAGGSLRVATSYLVVAALAGFMLRQPITILAKVRAGRRPARDVAAARFWILVYASIASLHIAGLTLRGFGYVLYLALPGVPVFAWYVFLVMRRAERRRLLVEVLAAGALCLSAPAAMWIGRGVADAQGWLLWALVWTGFAGAIVYTYLRLEQRTWTRPATPKQRLAAARAALLVSAGTLLAVAGLAFAAAVSAWLLLPFGIQLVECLWGTWHPAAGWRPRRIGMRQLVVSALFTLAFALAWTSPAA